MNMAKTVTVITGCSTGVGLAAAIAFARRGDTVVATMRDVTRADALQAALADEGLHADIRQLDVADDASVAAAIAAVIADHGGVDVVVANAGVGSDGTTEELTLDDFRAMFETNTLGVVRLLHAVLPGWRANGGGRFIAVSSMAGVLGNPFNDAYCGSKFAMEGILESLHPVAAQFGVHVSIVEPGPVVGVFSTKLAAPASRTADSPYAEIRARFQVLKESSARGGQSNAEVADVIVDVASAEKPVLRYQTSEMVAKLVGLKLNDLSGERWTGITARWV
jgi:NAD(P)-dependent dehydrogenase (short-subunit alcohol dehydrogenase family)